MSFERLLEPMGLDGFLDEYFERKPLVLHRAQPDFYGGLLTLDDIDRHIATATPKHPQVSLVNADEPVAREAYVGPDGLVDAARLFRLHAEGATIVLTQMQTRFASLAELCRAAERRVSHRFQCNLYLSPPGAQGFRTHYDSHDVFVLQIAGSKHWTLYDTVIELPLAGQKFSQKEHPIGAPSASFTLSAGDLLYCPRGLAHDARSTNEASLHVTFGLTPKTWADLFLEAVAAMALADPEFRRSLPVGFARPDFDREPARATFRALVERFAAGAALDPLLDEFRHDFVIGRSAALDGQLHQARAADSLTPGSVVGARPNLIYLVEPDEDAVHLVWRATRLTFPAFVHEPLVFALEHERFAVAELPGTLDEAGKLVLVRRLVREGLLQIHGN